MSFGTRPPSAPSGRLSAKGMSFLPVKSDAPSTLTSLAGSRKRPRSDSSSSSSSSGYGSIISRSSSPPAHNRDLTDDQLVKMLNEEAANGSSTQKAVNVDTELDEANVGMKMLLKMGWGKGEGLGVGGKGRKTPIPHNSNPGMLGVGKATLDTRMLDETAFKRRELESEKQANEGGDRKKAREERVAKQESIKAEIKETLKAFHCELCDKGYANVTQYNEHLNSYDHHHKARFIEMKKMEKQRQSGETAKRLAKEKKREEKEFARMMGNAGAAMGGSGGGLGPVSVSKPIGSSGGGGFKKVGWSAVGGGQKSSSNGGGGGWNSIGGAEKKVGGGSGWSKVGGTTTSGVDASTSSSVGPSTSSNTAPSENRRAAPMFQSAGYTKLDLDQASSMDNRMDDLSKILNSATQSKDGFIKLGNNSSPPTSTIQNAPPAQDQMNVDPTPSVPASALVGGSKPANFRLQSNSPAVDSSECTSSPAVMPVDHKKSNRPDLGMDLDDVEDMLELSRGSNSGGKKPASMAPKLGFKKKPSFVPGQEEKNTSSGGGSGSWSAWKSKGSSSRR